MMTKRLWTAWAETNWQGQECIVMVATRLCAQSRLSVVVGRLVETGKHATAFAATAILVLFNGSVDLRGRPIVRTKSFPDMLMFLQQQQEKVDCTLETVKGSLTGKRLSVALETMQALHVYESVGVEAAAIIQQMTSKQCPCPGPLQWRA